VPLHPISPIARVPLKVAELAASVPPREVGVIAIPTVNRRNQFLAMLARSCERCGVRTYLRKNVRVK
jgi:hypothetical protein